MTNRTEQLEALLRKITDRAARPEKAGSTEILLQKVPAALIDEARDLLNN